MGIVHWWRKHPTSDLANWWDRNAAKDPVKVLRDKIENDQRTQDDQLLSDFVDAHPHLWVIAASVRTVEDRAWNLKHALDVNRLTEDLTSSWVDVLRFGEGAAETLETGKIAPIIQDCLRGLSIASAVGEGAQSLRPILGQTIGLYENISGGVCTPIAYGNAIRLSGQRLWLSLKELAEASGISLDILQFGYKFTKEFKYQAGIGGGGMSSEEMIDALDKLKIAYTDLGLGKDLTFKEIVEVAERDEGAVVVTVVNDWGSHTVALQKMDGRIRIVDRKGIYDSFADLPQGQISRFVLHPRWNVVLIKKVSAKWLNGVPTLMVLANAAVKLGRNMSVRELDQKLQEFKAKRTAVGSSGPAQAPMTIVVTSGDTLSDLARKVYGSDHYWPLLWDANRAVIGSHPNLVRPGMRLSAPPFSSFSNAQRQDAERRYSTWSKLQ